MIVLDEVLTTLEDVASIVFIALNAPAVVSYTACNSAISDASLIAVFSDA